MSVNKLSAALLVMAALGSACKHDDSKRIVREQPPGQLTKASPGQPRSP